MLSSYRGRRGRKRGGETEEEDKGQTITGSTHALLPTVEDRSYEK